MEFTVQDMTCGHCAATITEAVKAVDPDGRCEIDVAARRVKVASAFSPERIAAAISKAGFSPVPIASA
ncbi:MAG: heavy-metal-associated domain-containing protein [Betaproteobacteria bacterium]|nr:heavy-metal-associated domain-containing protein [Betaproteobacteria bacterium]